MAADTNKISCGGSQGICCVSSKKLQHFISQPYPREGAEESALLSDFFEMSHIAVSLAADTADVLAADTTMKSCPEGDRRPRVNVARANVLSALRADSSRNGWHL